MNHMPPENFSLGGAVDLTPLVQKSMRAQAPSAPGTTADAGAAEASTHQVPQVVDVPSLVLDVTDETFQAVAQLSAVVPVVVDLWAEWCEPCKTLSPILEKVTRAFAGKVLLAKVDVDQNPQLAQAFQPQSIPTVVAIVGGKPVPLFQGAIPEQQVTELFDQLIALAQQSGVVGSVSAPDVPPANGEPEETELPPLHQEAFDAIEREDYKAAIAAYEQAIMNNPQDADALAGLSQVRLLHRLQGKSLEQIRARASAEPTGLEAQLDVADLDLSGGHVEDAFARLLELFANADEEQRQAIRERLLELFDMVGLSDPRVLAARRQLTSLLY
jgi:putative thioredoxin